MNKAGRPKLFGIVNIILGEEVVPELFQKNFTPELVCQTTLKLMEDVWLQSRIRNRYDQLKRQLGGGKVPRGVPFAVEGVGRGNLVSLHGVRRAIQSRRESRRSQSGVPK